MDDVLNLIRSIAEELDDPPEIPSHAEMRDAEQVEEAAQQTHVAERFVGDPDPTIRSPQLSPEGQADTRTPVPSGQTEAQVQQPNYIAPAEVVARSAEAPKEPSTVQRVAMSPFTLMPEQRQQEQNKPANPDPKTSVAPPFAQWNLEKDLTQKITQPFIPQAAQVKGTEYQVASQPTSLPNVSVAETLRVAAAGVTAGLNERGMPAEIDPTLNARVDTQQVTPSIRVVTMIPDGFPVDANHAFAIMDRDIHAPNTPFGDFPEMAGEFASFPEMSTEELVNRNSQDLSMSEDLVDRSGF